VLFTDTVFGTIKNRVLVLDGYVMSIRVERGQLIIRDGVGDNIVERRFSRANCPFDRLITTQTEGSITMSAMRWLSDAGVAVAGVAYDGTPIFTSCLIPPPQPAGLSQGSARRHPSLRDGGLAALRRRQALLSIDTEPGRSLAFSLLYTKLAGQFDLLNSGEHTRPEQTAGNIFQPHLPRLNGSVQSGKSVDDQSTQLARTFQAGSLHQILSYEGIAASSYWTTLASHPLRFSVHDQKSIPEDWIFVPV